MSELDEALKLARETIDKDEDAEKFISEFSGPQWRNVYDRACRETPRRLDPSLVRLARALLACQAAHDIRLLKSTKPKGTDR